MAGNIQWFRWHHGSVTDPKFKLVAHKSKQSLSSVIAVWAFVLEQASAADSRGDFGDVDCEAIDCLLGLDDGATESIIEAMTGRGLLANGTVCAWEQRQPKRERIDENSTERSKAFRQKQRHATPENSIETPETDDATPRNATQRQETPREEKKREEKKEETPRKRSAAPQRPADVGEQVWSDWLALRKAKRAPVTETVLASAVSEAEKAQLSLDAFLTVWCARGSQGLEAAWLKPDERGSSKTAENCLKYQSPEYFDHHRKQRWWANAGFLTVEEATAAGCNHKNFSEFRNGSREVAA